jgi:ABC-type sugar transport system permease subunit
MDAAIERHRDSLGVARWIIIWLALSLTINLVIAFSIAALTNGELLIYWLVPILRFCFRLWSGHGPYVC